jgi:hypothetical protein
MIIDLYCQCSAIQTKDINTAMALTIVTDRSQGGSSLANGQLELMVHRRLVAHRICK